MSTKSKTKRCGKITVSTGDTVKLSKGRIGLVRFIGKTQFGLGEWIGIELYNELIKTRHNGAVIGKRYFRCPPHRGIFVRRKLIRENIAVLDIDPTIKRLRAKEKKLKEQWKEQKKRQRQERKFKNEEKREAKRQKLAEKYGDSAVTVDPEAVDPVLDDHDDAKNIKSGSTKSTKTKSGSTKSMKSKTPKSSTSTKDIMSRAKGKKLRSLSEDQPVGSSKAMIKSSKKSKPKSSGSGSPTTDPSARSLWSSTRRRPPSKPKIIGNSADTASVIKAMENEQRSSRKDRESSSSSSRSGSRSGSRSKSTSRSRTHSKGRSESSAISGGGHRSLSKGPRPLHSKSKDKYPKKQVFSTENSKSVKLRKNTDPNSNNSGSTSSNVSKSSLSKKSKNLKSSKASKSSQKSKSKKGDKEYQHKAVLKESKVSKSSKFSKPLKSEKGKIQKGTKSLKSNKLIKSKKKKKGKRDRSESTPEPQPKQRKKPKVTLSTTPKVSPIDALAEGTDSDHECGSNSNSSDDILEPEPIIIDTVRSAPEMDRVREFNTGFKRHLMERNQKDSLQILKIRQQRQQQEEQQKMEKIQESQQQKVRNDDIEAVDDDIDRKHVHNESINVFDRNEMANVIEEAKADTFSPISPLETVPIMTRLENGGGSRSASSASESEDGDDDDKEFESELEEDFEERKELITTAVTEYTTTINVFESGRKRLAHRFVVRAKRRRSSALQEILRDRRTRGSALAVAIKASSSRVGRSGSSNKQYRRRRNAVAVAVRKRRFDNARSRRGSSFVDDYNVNDTLFFDGEEANQAVSDSEEMAVDAMEDSDDDDDDEEKEDDIDDEKDIESNTLLKTDLSAEVIDEEADDECDSEPEVDPLLGTDYDEDTISGDFSHIHGDELDINDTFPASGLALAPQYFDEESTEVILEQSPTPVSHARLSLVANSQQMGPLELTEDDDGNGDDDDEGEMKVFEIESNGKNEKQILFYEDLHEFLEWESNDDGCGIRIKAIKENEFGRALVIESGLKSGWQITIVDGDNIGAKMRVYILSRIQKCNAKKGYHVTFERKRKNAVLKPSAYKKARNKKKVKE